MLGSTKTVLIWAMAHGRLQLNRIPFSFTLNIVSKPSAMDAQPLPESKISEYPQLSPTLSCSICASAERHKMNLEASARSRHGWGVTRASASRPEASTTIFTSCTSKVSTNPCCSSGMSSTTRLTHACRSHIGRETGSSGRPKSPIFPATAPNFTKATPLRFDPRRQCNRGAQGGLLLRAFYAI